MSLQSKIVEYFDLKEIKVRYVQIQNYERATINREAERKAAREVYEMACGKCESGSDWKKYEDWIDEYCIYKYGRTGITTPILREIKIDELGIE
jgi:hypothetical protein